MTHDTPESVRKLARRIDLALGGVAFTASKERRRVTDDAAQMAERYADLLERLPVTADGVPIVHGMTLWAWTQEGTLLLDVEADLGCFIGNGDSGRRITCHAERCYSTREAAEAARENDK